MNALQKSLFLILTIISYQSFADQITFTSKDKTSTVIELFTSQGCSSCPPAEEYINGYVDNKELWSKYIPIVFHVDYWDYIGWKDVFAKPQFTSRQYLYAKLKHVRTVYTPAFIVNGSAWRRGFFNSYPDAKGLNLGILDVVINGDSVKANLKVSESGSKTGAGTLNLNIAILGMDMIVEISAGENEGRKAKHNFVVLGHSSQLSNTMTWKMELPKIKQSRIKHQKIKQKLNPKFALVAWVSSKDDPTPLQAIGGWLP